MKTIKKRLRRLQLVIDLITFGKIVELQTLCNYQSITEVVRRAIDLLYALQKQQTEGYELLLKKDNVTIKVMLL